MTNKNFPLTYNQTITEVSWPLGLKNLNNEHKCQKIEKNGQKCQKYAKNGDVKILQTFHLI